MLNLETKTTARTCPGIYLCARRHRLYNYNIIYNDIEKKYDCDITRDCLSIDLRYYNFVIATPPCNYYSKANYRRDTSEYALKTKDILPSILAKLIRLNDFFFLPFIVENVCNDTLLPKEFDKYCYRFTFGGHTFWTNILLDYSDLVPVKNQHKQEVATTKRDDNYNVHIILERFCDTISNDCFIGLTKYYSPFSFRFSDTRKFDDLAGNIK